MDENLDLYFAFYTSGRIFKIVGESPALIGWISPGNFMLEQNYPNPFNPETIIRFSLPESQNTKIEIFDTLGRNVEKLLDERIEAGEHEIKWNPDRLVSGVYIYKLTSGNYLDSKKMILIR